MVRTLRITSFALAGLAVLAVVVLALLGVAGLGPYAQFLAQPGVVAQMKGQVATPAADPQSSPLISQARALALRLDPPPPPPVRQEPTEKPIVQEPLRPTPVMATVRFELLATAYNPAFPDLSLALIQPTNSPLKWVRKGEKIGHFEVGDIQDGKMTLLKDGQVHSELKTPLPSRPYKPLLKSDALAQGLPTQTVNRPFASLADAVMQSTAADTAIEPAAGQAPAEMLQPAPEGMPAGVSRSVRLRQAAQRPIGNAAVNALPAQTAQTEIATPPAPEPPQPTIQQQLASVEESIQSIRQIMSQQRPDASPEEVQQEMQAWQSLLEVLEAEKKNLQKQASEPSD